MRRDKLLGARVVRLVWREDWGGWEARNRKRWLGMGARLGVDGPLKWRGLHGSRGDKLLWARVAGYGSWSAKPRAAGGRGVCGVLMGGLVMRGSRRLLYCLLGWAGGALLSGAVRLDSPPSRQHPSREEAEAAVAAINRSVPTHLAPRISGSELDRWRKRLDLTAEQAAAFDQGAARYEDAMVEVARTLEPEMKEKMTRFVDLRAAGDHAAANLAYLHFLHSCKGIEEASVKHEEMLFAALRGVLDEGQLQLWQRFAMRRVGAWACQRHVSLIRSGWFSLHVFTDPLEVSEPLPVDADEILFQYEQQVTPHFRVVNAEYYPATENVQHVVAQRITTVVDGREHVTTLPDERERMNAAWLRTRRALKTIAEINDLYCDRLVAVLPEKEAMALRDAYRRKAYPDVWPDHFSISGLVDAATGVEDPPGALREALSTLRAQYVERHAQITRDMMKRRREHEIEATFHNDGSPAPFMEYAADMTALNAKRSRLNDDTMRTLQNLLGDEWLPRISDAMNAYGEQVERMKLWTYQPMN